MRTVAGLAFATVVFFGFGEAVTRLFDVVDLLNGYARQLFTAGPSAELPYRLRPGVEVMVAGATVHVNAAGLRGPEVTATPAAGVTRVLVLGDSVVFGQGVGDDATLPAVLAERLKSRWQQPVEVLNAGVQGYDTVAEAAFLAGPGLALHPHQVVVGMSLNDYDQAPAYDATGVLSRRAVGQPRPGLIARSEFMLLLRWLYAWTRGELLTQLLERASQKQAATPAPANPTLDQFVIDEHTRFYSAPPAAEWSRLRDAMQRLRDTAAAAHLPLLIAILPESYQVGTPTPDLTAQQRISTLCKELAVRCLDLQPSLQAVGGSLFQDVQHPNAQGLAIAADAIAAALTR